MRSIQSVTFLLFFLLLPFSSTIIGQEPPPVVRLEIGQIHERKLDKSQPPHVFNVRLTAGQYAQLRVEPRTAAAVTIYSTTDAPLVKTRQPFIQPIPYNVSFVAEMAGDYRIELQQSDDLSGTCRIKLATLKTANAEDRERAEVDRVFFEAISQSPDSPEDPAVFRKAVESLDRLRMQWQSLGDKEMESATIFRSGLAHGRLHETSEELARYREAEALIRALPERPGLATVLERLSYAYDQMGDTAAAIKAGEEALALARASGDRQQVCHLLEDISMVYSNNGDPQKAIEYEQAALVIARELGLRSEEASILLNLGVSYSLIGDDEQSNQLDDQALAAARVAGDKTIAVIALINLSGRYAADGDFAKAMASAQESLDLVKTIQYPYGEAGARNAMGRVLLKSKRYAEAEEHFNVALNIARNIKDDFKQTLSLVFLSRSARARGDKLRALDYLTDALAHARSRGLRIDELGILAEIALVERDLGKLDEAQRRLEGVLDSVEGLRSRIDLQQMRAGFFSTMQHVYAEYVALLMARSSGAQPAERAIYTARAFNTSERARARSLVEMLAELGRGKRQDMLTAMLAHESEGTLKIEDVQRDVLDERTLLLEYALGEDRSYLFAVTQTGLTSYELPKRSDIESLARHVNELMRLKSDGNNTKDTRELEAATRRLSDMILRPVADQLGNRRLLIVADGALRYVSFAALADPKAVGKLPTPLIVKHEIASIPSATTLAVLRRELKDRPLAPKQLAVLADPVFGVYDDRVSSTAKERQPATLPAPAASTLAELERGIREDGRGLRLPRLPFSREEAEAISSLAQPSNRSKSLDFTASRETAISDSLADYQYIHFATHGLLNGAHPELSGLFFSMVNERGESQNGLLRVDEIYNLKLPAELVVLSACETALGKDIKGEGVVGLTRGFMYAGARRVVASLWKVNDAATAELMKRFYQGMLGSKKLSPSAALREAQLSMWADKKDKRWQSPYYWAAFVLQGEW